MISEKYSKLTLKNKIIASLIGLALVILSLLYFIVIPTTREIKIMGNDIEAQRVDLEKKYIKGQSLKQLTENLKKIEPKLELLDKVFVIKNHELEFITTLENQANKNQISQKINLSPPQATENPGLEKISLQLYAKGEFIKQLKYLMDLESLNYYINIKSLELLYSPAEAPAAAGDKPGDITISINADTY